VAAFQEITEVEVCVDRIRRHFARMLVHSVPVDPQALFNHFVDDLCDGPVDDAAVDVALLSVEDMMNAMGRSLTDSDYGFALPDPDGAGARARSSRRRVNPDHAQMSRAEAQVEADRLLPLFTVEQSDAMQKVLQSVRSQAACNVFVLLSSAGCGKTAFANGVSAYVRANGGTVVSVAASAMAAMLLTGGRTAHSALHIPIPAHDASMCNLSHEERQSLQRADIIIYDEVSMVHEHVADTVDRSLRDVMKDERPFGGKTVILMGDFKQLLPVVRYGSGHQHTVQKCVWWKHVQHLKFTKNWRAAEHPDYVEFLENVGYGEMETVQVPQDRVVSDVDQMIDNVYGHHFATGNQILALTLETCAMVNKACLERLPGHVVECPSADTYCHRYVTREFYYSSLRGPRHVTVRVESDDGQLE
jgi:ATP-dependent DNA helicase PIF1